MPMRILQLVFNTPNKGTYRRAYYLARELARRGHSVTLLHTSEQERRHFHFTHEVEGRLALVAAPDLLRGGMRAGWEPWGIMARLLWMQLPSYDIVHAFECRPGVLVPALWAKRKAPLVIDWCDWFGWGGSMDERDSWLVRMLLGLPETFFEERFRRYADATTTINQVLADRAIALGVPPAQITRFPNGCDVDPLPTDSVASIRSELTIPLDAPVIGYVGVVFRRDAELMAHAFDRVQQRYPNAKFLVLGDCNIPLDTLVADPQAVIKTGRISPREVQRYLRAAQVAWVPLSDTGANRGRWPLKISAYMEVGIPFVTTDIGDLNAFLAQYPVGVAAQPNPASVAAQTIDLLADPQRAAALGAAGQYVAMNDLSWPRVTDTIETLYQRLIAERAATP